MKVPRHLPEIRLFPFNCKTKYRVHEYSNICHTVLSSSFPTRESLWPAEPSAESLLQLFIVSRPFLGYYAATTAPAAPIAIMIQTMQYKQRQVQEYRRPPSPQAHTLTQYLVHKIEYPYPEKHLYCIIRNAVVVLSRTMQHGKLWT